MTENIVDVDYHATGKSTNTNKLGMREMQAKVYEKRNSKYLLVKAPPASGKSRALMFVAIDKLKNQGIKKVIVAVPEKSIGSSFKTTNLKKYGFYEDWEIKPQNNLTAPGSDKGKVKSVIRFMESDDQVLVLTHATLRFAYQEILNDSVFDDCLIAIDEFHHVSAAENSVLGEALRNIMKNSSAHILAMTGSYFRGDDTPILSPEDEDKFDKVTYSYYEQLDGYQYLKSFGIGYNFYQGKYTDSIADVIDVNKKMIIHIPNVNSSESSKDKLNEVDSIIDTIGDVESVDDETGIIFVRSKTNGKLLKIADLVTVEGRDRVAEYLRTKVNSVDDLDILIALGMAKEGFDWPWAEYALTIGYRGSLTEIVQIIGRVTRDSPNKTHAQFTNLIAQPDAKDDEVNYTVNTMLKAITASLLMEQVLAPDFKFKPRRNKTQKSDLTGELFVKGIKEPTTTAVKNILSSDLVELKEKILSDKSVQQSMKLNIPNSAQIMNQVLVPKVIQAQYPNLSSDEVETVRQHVVADMVMRNAKFETNSNPDSSESDEQKFIKMGKKFIKVDELDINLIDQINPLDKAYEVLSRAIDVPTLKIIQNAIDADKYHFDNDELVYLAPKILQFKQENGYLPRKNSSDEMEVRYAYALAKLQEIKAKRGVNNE
ncbi:DEAD/DEAH box helicase [Fructobacillus durionis]|uniref:Superfamily II DNA or RNA helicase n=1 Tax=Fructobacillus durionis TaxID=283737 RepID=A0A1I1GAI7_9LACO|nr:DEAD/DEAH box helicase family protein [Fructobacillus durionis]SFC06150.1 Superfamily II DNA or RNA helicase [Fructobacillus durionis]